MPKSIDELTADTIRQGGVQALFYFDLHAPTADEVKNIMVGVCARLTKEPGVVYAVGEIEAPMERQGLYSTTTEVKILTKDFTTIARLAGMYSPMAVEVLKPGAEIRLSLYEAQTVLLNISLLSHEYTQVIMEKMLSAEDKAKYQQKVAHRQELGKRLLEKTNAKPHEEKKA